MPGGESRKYVLDGSGNPKFIEDEPRGYRLVSYLSDGWVLETLFNHEPTTGGTVHLSYSSRLRHASGLEKPVTRGRFYVATDVEGEVRIGCRVAQLGDGVEKLEHIPVEWAGFPAPVHPPRSVQIMEISEAVHDPSAIDGKEVE